MKKVAMVTGAGEGIGMGICRVLAREGYDLMIHTATNLAPAEKLRDELIASYGIRAYVVKADFLHPGAFQEMFREFDAKFDRLDLFCNNAGITEGAPFLEMSEETFERVVNINLKGSFFCTQEAAKRMIRMGIEGSIVLLSSNLREYIQPHMSVYGPVKSAIAQLAKNEAMELAPYGIRVNAIAPGWVDSSPRLEPHRESSKRNIPLGKWATVEQVGELVLYLASQKGDFFTGSVLTMDGGASCQRDPDYRFDV